MILDIVLVLAGLILALFIYLLLVVKYKDWRAKHSWDISWISSREPGEPSSIKYTEKDRYFSLYGSLEENKIIMPDKNLWEANMPEFWKEKWDILKQRIEKAIKRNATLKITSNVEEISGIDCFDNNLPIGHADRVIRIKFPKNASFKD